MSKKGKHKTIDKELKPSVSWLESLPYVKKVVLGIAESARHKYSPGTLKYQFDQPGGVKIKAYGGKGVMDLYVKITPEHKPEFLKRLSERWKT
jgi:hypothetical protein